MRKRYMYFLLGLFCWPILTFGQQQIGWRTENHAGINSIFINPAFPAHFPLNWDVNLFNVGFFFDNNYAFVKNSSILDLYLKSSSPDVIIIPETDTRPNMNGGSILVDFFKGTPKRYISFLNHTMGPSFMVKIKENHSIGLFSAARFQFSSQNVPGAFSYYTYQPFPLYVPFRVHDFEGSMMAWSELGLNYSYRHISGINEFSFGLSVKHLQGYEAAYFHVKDAFNLTKHPKDSIFGDRANLEYALTTYGIENLPNAAPKVNGTGFGFSLGATYAVKKYDDKKPYDYRVGFSLLDIGGINFNKNAEKHSLQTDSVVVVTPKDYQGLNPVEQLDEVIRIFSYEVLRDSAASLSANSFRMFLPGALSIQGDYAFSEKIYANFTWVQRFSFLSNSPERANLVALTPRFETRWFSIATPLLLYNWNTFKFGGNLRLGYLVLGSENLQSIFINGTLTGSDFFIALKVNPFEIDFEPVIKQKRKRGRVKCFKF